MSQDFQTGWRNQRNELDKDTRAFEAARPLIVLIALVCWGYIFLSIIHGNASRSWTGTIGTVTSSQIEAQVSTGTGFDYQAKITYQYDFAGRSLVNTAIEAPFNSSGIFLTGMEQSQRLVAKYPPRSQVVVYVDGANPSNSCLVPGINPVTLLMLGNLAVVCTILAVPVSWIRYQTEMTYKAPLKRGNKGWIVESETRHKM